MYQNNHSSISNNQMSGISITVFFPCFNEQENVERVTKKAVEVLQGIKADYEIILVDDGSKDNTPVIVDNLSQVNKRIRAIHHETNKGYGAALQTGFRSAVKEYVFYTDGDGQFDIEELPPLLPLMSDCDIVSCYRKNRQDSLVRKMNAFCWTTLVNLLFKMRIRDIDCAFKLFKREIFDNIEMQSTGALIDTEILARSIRKGYKVVQKPVKHYPRMHGQQTGANIKVIMRAFRELFRLRKAILHNN